MSEHKQSRGSPNPRIFDTSDKTNLEMKRKLGGETNRNTVESHPTVGGVIC